MARSLANHRQAGTLTRPTDTPTPNRSVIERCAQDLARLRLGQLQEFVARGQRAQKSVDQVLTGAEPTILGAKTTPHEAAQVLAAWFDQQTRSGHLRELNGLEAYRIGSLIALLLEATGGER